MKGTWRPSAQLCNTTNVIEIKNLKIGELYRVKVRGEPAKAGTVQGQGAHCPWVSGFDVNMKNMKYGCEGLLLTSKAALGAKHAHLYGSNYQVKQNSEIAVNMQFEAPATSDSLGYHTINC